MFYRYEIHQKNKEKILYLYLSMKYEFANELSIEKQESLEKKTKNFILSNNIPFHGNKVYLIIDGIVVRTLNLSKMDEMAQVKNEYSANNFLLSMRLEDQSLCEITLYDYLVSILLSKYEKNIPDEVYKAITILFSTYAYKCMKEDGYLSNQNSFATYYPITYYQNNLKNLKKIINKFQMLIQEVDGLFLSYKKDYILPFIHYSNEGKTKTNKHYPYLSSVKSLWDLASPYYIEVKDISYTEINQKYGILLNNHSNISITIDESTKKIMLDNKNYTIEEFKNLFQLKSSNIYFILYSNHLRIITKGYGNSYGLSIFGATEMANDGIKYYDILKYYFPKTKLSKHTKELS